mgnify:CR=1 FL=1
MPERRNWKEYNEKLVRRGEIYVSLDFLDNWEKELEELNRGKRGRPYKYPHSFMLFLAFLHVAFLPFRQLEGFLRGLSKYIPELKIADYTTIFKRLKKIKIEIPLQELGNDVIIALDSTGMKISSRGEWIRHKWKVRKGWVKVHIAVDIKTKKLLALEITDERIGDGKMLKPLMRQAKRNINGGRIKAVYGDGTYDSRDNFNFLDSEEIEPIIKTRKDASIRAKGSPSRAKMVREMKKLGYEGWRDKYRYGDRWAVETFFSGVKRTFGETTIAKTVEGVFQEVKLKFLFYNMLLSV